MEMIIDSVGRDKAFTRLYHDHGPVVLTENFWPIINVILAYDGTVTVSTVLLKLPLYLPADVVVAVVVAGYNVAIHYLTLIQTMVVYGYLELDTKMQLSLAEGLLHDE